MVLVVAGEGGDPVAVGLDVVAVDLVLEEELRHGVDREPRRRFLIEGYKS